MLSGSQPLPSVSSDSAETESQPAGRLRLAAATPSTRSRLPPASAQTKTTQIPSQRVSHGIASTLNTVSQYSPSIFDHDLANPAAASTRATSTSDLAWPDDHALPPQDDAETLDTYGYMCRANPCFQANCYVHVDASVLQEYLVTGTGAGFVSTDDESDTTSENNDDL